MADMVNMVGGLNLEGAPGLTGDVEVNELTSLQRFNRRILRRTAEVSTSLNQFRKSSNCNRIEPVCRWRFTYKRLNCDPVCKHVIETAEEQHTGRLQICRSAFAPQLVSVETSCDSNLTVKLTDRNI